MIIISQLCCNSIGYWCVSVAHIKVSIRVKCNVSFIIVGTMVEFKLILESIKFFIKRMLSNKFVELINLKSIIYLWTVELELFCHPARFSTFIKVEA